MERRRALGFGAMGLGIALVISAKAISNWELALVGTVALVGGGAGPGLSYRDESKTSPGGSPLSLIWSSVNRRAPSSGRGRPSPDPTANYAQQLNDELVACRLMLAEPARPRALEQAREKLMVLVANPRYGAAIERGLVEEQAVLDVSERLARTT
ncbi:MAG: hypothetical protein ACYCSF_14105 [Acidimicrobiales bacterium]